MTIYKTEEYKGSGKQNYYWNEYRKEGNKIIKYKCNRFKSFDGDENVWNNEEKIEDSWDINAENMPEWLNQYI